MLNQVFRTGVMTPAQIQIGEWRANHTTNELGRADDTVRIEPKVMEVLMVLADRAGEVVSRDDLLAAVWPGVVVGDDALTQSIIKLRKALGDSPRSPSYIETIAKRGYRLIAPVVRGHAVPATHDERGPAPQQSPAPTRRSRRRFGMAASIALVLVTANFYLFGSRSQLLPVQQTVADAADEDKAGLLTVTVLPFETVGVGAEQGYLARGISSDLMTDLSRLSGLRLISASGTTASGHAASTARYVVSGSVQRDGATLRVNVRLTDSRTNEQLWSQRFERPFGDLLAIQNDVSRGLMAQLPGKISDAELRQAAKRYTSNPEAYEYFLRAQALFLARRPEENDRARVLFQKALDLDPQFTRAYAGLAMTYAMDYRYQRSAEPSATLGRALELAETARTIDPDIPEVYWALGFIHAQARRYDQAIESLQKAIELNRSYADAYALLGGIYTYVGQPARSIPLLRTALRLNPDGGYLYFLLLGRAYLFENDIEQALINLREAVRRNPDDLEAHIYLAAALVADGNRSAAEWEGAEIRARDGDFSMRRWLETYPLTSERYKQRLLELTAKVQL
ncbi:MAG TPA: tetratricopeptide repeat protein [Verrucomicrobiae bacterium]|nr:tetratricopeptide repeat protein [Verrucomicrobiae bacterium]